MKKGLTKQLPWSKQRAEFGDDAEKQSVNHTYIHTCTLNSVIPPKPLRF